DPYDPDDPAEFHATLARTYEDTLDCPEVSGVRTIEQVIEGYRAQGRYEPGRWWLAREAGRPVGVAIVTALPGSGDWEVGYMGLVPPARGRGLGILACLRVAPGTGLPTCRPAPRLSLRP